MHNIFNNYKVFDIDPFSLRSENFYKSIIDARESFWEERKILLKDDNEARCILCKDTKKTLFLTHYGYKLFQCENCKTVYANLSFDKNYTKLIYDNKHYEEKVKRDILETYDYRKSKFGSDRLDYINKKCNFNNHKKLLDIGCGAGYFLKYLQENNIECKGLELTDYLVEVCKEKGINVENKDLREEENLHYDVITMFDVIEHLTDPLKFFQMANQKLKENGHILFYTPNIHSFAFHFQKGKQNLLLPYEHVAFYNLDSLNFLAHQTGFKIKSIEYFGLDLVDYFSMKEFEDNFSYNKKLSEIIPYLQALIDKENISNHMRVVFSKK